MNSIKKIYERYPKIEEKHKNPNDPQLILTNQEAVFYQLAEFFKKPDEVQFSLNMIYNYLKNDELLFAIQVMIEFFQKDTSLTQDIEQSFYDTQLSRENILGQKSFAELVQKSMPGVKFKPSMVHVYWKRKTGRIPNADLIIDGTPYWKETTVKSFIEKEKVYRADKDKKRLERND
ncbi:hypothetical protein [Bacillus subtilis]|uniref:hypothetical protein n=1 Tax=Bacillus subtilis TaxID=1423 RepID=UPI001B9C475C|nr:hypothetical protein [Bacillus subtilis]CAI6330877.1 hypothetical protein NRS6096_22150 [Bacillus subtilis]